MVQSILSKKKERKDESSPLHKTKSIDENAKKKDSEKAEQKTLGGSIDDGKRNTKKNEQMSDKIKKTIAEYNKEHEKEEISGNTFFCLQ